MTTIAHPLTLGEREALAGDGSLGAALAAHALRFVFCEHGAFRGDDWHEHTHDVTARDHAIYAIERHADYVEDCVLVLP